MNEAQPIRAVSLDSYLDSHDIGINKPLTAMEALMSAAPHSEPEESIEELQPFREAVAECMELLTEQDRYIIDSINSERVTLQVLGDRLGVSRMHASRLRDAAFSQLKDIMLKNPTILKRLSERTSLGDYDDE